jgi:hypothetical protein
VKRAFTVTALWDEEIRAFISQSDIKGLHIEAQTIEEFEEIMHEVAIDLIVANHFSAPEIASTSMRDLIPAIFWQRPSKTPAFA